MRMGKVRSKRLWRRVLEAAIPIGLAATFSSGARADVLGITDDAEVGRGGAVVAEMQLLASGPIVAISGELTYDPTMLTYPRVMATLNARGYTALGYITNRGDATNPAHFRFLLYKKPCDAELSQTQTVIQFQFDVIGFGDAVTQVGFPLATAARIASESPLSVVSVGVGGKDGNPPPEIVTFQSFSVHILTGVKSWQSYE